MSIFKKGDKVHHHEYGWGTVVPENDEKLNVNTKNEHIHQPKPTIGVDSTYVLFKIPKDFEGDVYFFSDILDSELSFTKYSLQGFSQERPINYEDYIGCWGRFWDGEGGTKIEGILKNIENGDYPYHNRTGASYKHFEPYPQEVLTALRLK